MCIIGASQLGRGLGGRGDVNEWEMGGGGCAPIFRFGGTGRTVSIPSPTLEP